MKKAGLSILVLLSAVILVSLLVTRRSEQQVEKIRTHIDYNQYQCPPVEFVAGENQDLIQQGKALFPNIEGLPKQFEDVFYLALYHYPELSGNFIEVVFKPIGTTLQVQPAAGFIFKRKSTRGYRIFINSNLDFEGILFKDVPYNAQVGLVAHELAHILDYNYKNSFQIIGTGLKFLNKNSRSRYEKSIDLLTVYKGLGWQLLDWAQYAMFDSKATDDYKAFKKSNYLDPEEITEIISNHPEICRLFR
jgi:hypothetical protein